MEIVENIKRKTANIDVIGLGYVGLPLAIEFGKAGFHVMGFDIDPDKVELLKNSKSYTKYVPSEGINEKGIPIKDAKILIIDLAYKKDVGDVRESPSLKLIELFRARGAKVDYNDPYVPKISKTWRYDFLMESVPLAGDKLASYDCVVISTNHSAYDCGFVIRHSGLIVDTRNAIVEKSEKRHKGKLIYEIPHPQH